MATDSSKSSAAGRRVYNVNVGVLGHVDSGKTSLVAALSTILSTAALDKNPQSKERGITLDLGFSSFTVPLPPRLAHLPFDELQFTLVDCPGHASLIRTILGGVQIIDMMVLVIDITKGLQTQTAECLVVGEIATNNLVVALNKCDMLPEGDRPKLIKKAIKRLASTFDMTKFSGVTMIPVSAKPGGGVGQEVSPAAEGINTLRDMLVSMLPAEPRPAPSGRFLFAVDHCFPIKGQGTVLTGTVLHGSVSVGETIELPTLKLNKQVKSMQMFKRPVTKAVKGDRVGICVTQLDATLIERGLACTPGSVPTFSAAIAMVDKIRFHAGRVPSKAKFHINVGHTTVMAKLTFFGLPDGKGIPADAAIVQMISSLQQLAVSGATPELDLTQEYQYQEELHGLEGRPLHVPGEKARTTDAWQQAEVLEGGHDHHWGPQWVLLQFEQPITVPKDSVCIGARFDSDVHGDTCRLAFYGRLLRIVDTSNPKELAQLKVFKLKEKQGVIERIIQEQDSAIIRGLFKKETDPSVYQGLKITTGLGERGVIEGPFGKSGKLKAQFPGGLQQGARSPQDNTIMLTCKRYIYDIDRKKLKQ